MLFQNIKEIYMDNLVFVRVLLLSNIVLFSSVFLFVPQNGYDGPRGFALIGVLTFIGLPVLLLNLLCFFGTFAKYFRKKLPFANVFHHRFPFKFYLDIPLMFLGVPALLFCYFLFFCLGYIFIGSYFQKALF